MGIKLKSERKFERFLAARVCGVAAAMIGSAVVGGVVSSNAASKAAKAQTNAANQANATQQGMYDQTRADLSPYMDVGVPAASRLADLMGTSGNVGATGYGSLTQPFNADTFKQYLDPAYQWQLEQGQMALQNSQAANDGVLSGAALKDLMAYNQGMANTAYNNAFNQYQTQGGNIYQRLSGLASLGQNAAAQTGNFATNTGANMAQTTLGAGNAAAAGIVGQANAINSGLNGAAQGYMLYNLMK